MKSAIFVYDTCLDNLPLYIYIMLKTAKIYLYQQLTWYTSITMKFFCNLAGIGFALLEELFLVNLLIYTR